MGGDNSFFSEEHRNPTLYCVANETRNQLRRSKDTDTGSHYVREKKETANGRDIHSAFSYYTWLEQGQCFFFYLKSLHYSLVLFHRFLLLNTSK